jgi:short-subunit dehydrogenase
MQQGVLRGKAVIVTGASKGIGAEIARELARAGASVTVNFATDGAGAEKTMREIREHGGQAITVKANVSVRSDVENLFLSKATKSSDVSMLSSITLVSIRLAHLRASRKKSLLGSSRPMCSVHSSCRRRPSSTFLQQVPASLI